MKKRLKRIVASAVIMCIISSNSLVNTVITAYAETSDKKAVKQGQIYDINKDAGESLSSIAKNFSGKEFNMAHKVEDEVDIIVELESKSILEHYIEDNGSTAISSFTASFAGRSISNQILQEHKRVINRIQSEVSSDIEVKSEYSVVMNGFSVKAKYGDLEDIRQIQGVKNAFVASTYDVPTNPEIDLEPFMVNSGGYIGVTEANKSGYTGKNTVVAVIDTGLDITHEAFQQVPTQVKYSQEDINNIVTNAQLNARGNVYKSGKIPFAYDYADWDDNPADAGDHGTHVAGTVAANSEKIKGVAPDAQLMIMKVFSNTGGGASDRTILAALDDAVKLGADSINMSLGSAAGFTSEGQEVLNNTYNRVAKAGISLICAAGNDESSTVNSNKGNLPLTSNPDNSIVGSPSTYSAATSIASVNNIKSFAPYFTRGDLKVKYADTNEGTSKAFTSLQGEGVEYVVVPGVGSVSDFEKVDVTGKIALVQRGSIAFTEKEANAYAYGARGVIIYDNVDGALVNMQTGGKIPMIFISKADGEALATASENTININESYIDSFEDVTSGKMSDFSSWGLSPDLKLKPEITAPGGGIFSTLPGNSYGSMSGTSMASPHVAGATALVRQYINEKYTDLTTVQEDELLTNLLMSTASPVIDEHGVVYSPRKQGAGLINVNSAIKSGAYITAPVGKPKAELGDSITGEYQFTFDVNNVSENPLTYDLNTTVLTEKIISQNGENYFAQASRKLDSSEVTVTASESSLVVKPGEKKTITVSLKLTDKAKEALSSCENGTFVEGFVTLESQNEDKINLGLPFVGFYGDWSKAPTLDSVLYDDEEAVMWDTALAMLDIYSGNGYFLGVNSFTKELVGDADKIAIGSGLTGQNVVTSLVGLLRNATELNINITNDKGDKVYDRSLGQNSKSYYYVNGGFMTYAMDSNGWDAVNWDDRKVYPDGQYTYKVEAKGFGDDDANKEVLTFPLTIDTELPKMIGKENVTVDGKEYLKVTVKDNHYLQAVQLIDYEDNPLTEIMPLDADSRGFEHDLLFPLEDLKDIAALKIVGMDYANNYFESGDFGATEDGILPSRVKHNITDVWIRAGLTTQMEALVYPESAENKTVTWTSSDPSVATIDETGLLTAIKAGETWITVSTFNGKTDTTKVTVSPEYVEELKEPYVIEKNGKYSIPANLSNKTITIKNTATDVTINGNEVNTTENPYKGISVVSEEDTNLTINNLNITRTKSGDNVIDLRGKNNTLTINGENNFNSSASYSSQAMVNVPEGRALEIKGEGKLNIHPGDFNYGASIGGSARDKSQHNSGKIVISGGDINVSTSGGAAAIGGAGDGFATDIRIAGGKVTAIADINSSNYGAAIGSSGTGYNYEGKPGFIRITGGEVTAINNGGGAAIGDCKGGYTPYNIIISGGIVNAETTSVNASIAGAAIGGGSSSRGDIRITITGGQVNAKTSSVGAAIGGGSDNREGSVSIEGGTITAESTGKGAAIGNGYYGENQSVRLLKGSVKASSTQTGVDAIGNGEKGKNCSITGTDETTPYKTVIKAPNVTGIKVNGEDWKISKPHPEDDNVYLYLVNSQNPYIIEVSEGETVTQYKATVKDGNVTVEVLDLIPPISPVISEEGGLVTVTAADEDTAVIEYSLDKETWIVYSKPVQVQEKSTIYVRAIDGAGNVSEVAEYTVPDRTAPKAPAISEAGGVVTVIASDEDTDVIEYSFNGETWTVYSEPVQVPEKSTIHVRAIDAAGNVSGVVTYTVPDRTAPKAPAISEEGGVVTVIAADEDTAVIEYSLDGENWIVYTESVQVPEKGTIRVRAIDAVGNVSGVVTYTVPDRTAPKTPVISEEGGVVTVTAADEDTAVIEYSLDGENWTVYSDPVQVPEKSTIYVRAIDAVGNVSGVVTYTVPDRTAPATPKVSEEDGVVTVTAADDDTAVIEYSLDGENWTVYSDPVQVPEKSTIYVRAIDAEGNVSEATEYTVPDRTAPGKPVVEFKDGLVSVTASDDETVKMEYSFDGLTWMGYNEPFEVTENCTVFARATDEVGNVSEVSQLKVTINDGVLENLENLEKLVEEAEKLDKKLYTSSTWKKVDLALVNAKKVLALENPSKEEVLEAIKALEKAIEGLEEKKDNGGGDNNGNNGGNNNGNGNSNGNKPGSGLPQTGGTAGSGMIAMAGILASAAGAVIFKRKRK